MNEGGAMLVNEEDVCRTCLRSNIDELILMYQENGEEILLFDDISIPQMINECTPNKINVNDPLPKKICVKCIEDVKVAYNFRKQSETSYKTLMAFVNNDENDDEDDDEDNGDCEEIIDDKKTIIINETGLTKIDEDIPPTEKCIQTDEIAFYPCERCNAKFINYDALKEHRFKEHKGEENKCRVCSKSYNRMSHLKRHIAEAHKEVGIFQSNAECKICGKRYTRTERLKLHMKQCHNGELIESQSKTESNTDEFNMQNHEALVEDIIETTPITETTEVLDATEDVLSNSLDDNKLNESSSTSDDEEDIKPLAQLKAEVEAEAEANKELSSFKFPVLIKQIKTEPIEQSTGTCEKSTITEKRTRQPRKRHWCEKCNKSYSRSTHLRRHQLTHNGEKPFTCDVCQKGFTRIDHLNLHKLYHAEVKPYTCDLCPRGFIRPEHLRKHKESRHGERRLQNRKTEYCEACNRYFSSAKYLQIHMKSHIERRFNCKHCDKVYENKKQLHEHLKSHSNEKPYLCSECGLRFVRNDYLVIHMRRHNGEKPYKCKYCDKGFPRATDLTVHERYHTGEKTHLCTVCGKGFQRAYNLLVHTRVHTGERPYQCPHCSKGFAQGNDLKAHIRRHTGERFKCDICGSGFIQGYHLTQHKRAAHGIETQSHIRRVEKFVTPLEQQKRVEALQQNKTKNELNEETSDKTDAETNNLTESSSPSLSPAKKIRNNKNSTTATATNVIETMTKPIKSVRKESITSTPQVTTIVTRPTTAATSAAPISTTVTKPKRRTGARSENDNGVSGGTVTIATPTVLQIVDDGNEIVIEEEHIKIEGGNIETIETAEEIRINGNDDDGNQLLSATQYYVVNGSTFTPISSGTPIFFTEIETNPKVKYEN